MKDSSYKDFIKILLNSPKTICQDHYSCGYLLLPQEYNQNLQYELVDEMT